MKKYILILGLSFILTSETKAECSYGGNDCLTWNPGVADNCGRGCTYTYDEETSTVYVTASGDDAYIGRRGGIEWSFDDQGGNGISSDIDYNKVVIDGAITIGVNAFTGKSVFISGADGTLTLTNIGHHGFGDDVTLEGDIIIPAGAKFGSLAFHGTKLAEGAKIYCALEDCADKILQSCLAWGGEMSQSCYNTMSNVLSNSETFAQAPQGCSAFNGNGCQSCNNGYSLFSNQCVCAKNHRVNGKNCNRLIYTIDEANAVAGQKNRVSIKYR